VVILTFLSSKCFITGLSLPPPPPAALCLGALGTTHLSAGKLGSTSKSAKVLAGIQESKQGSVKSFEVHLGYPVGGGGGAGLEVVVVEEVVVVVEEEEEVVSPPSPV